jgi:hypothetical protein
MAEVFTMSSGLVLSGANTGGDVSVRQVSDLDPHIRPNGVHVRRISVLTLQRAANIAAGLRAIHSLPQHERLRNGFRAWLRGVLVGLTIVVTFDCDCERRHHRPVLHRAE